MKTKLEKSGDKMTGNLDMDNNMILNIKQDFISREDFDTTTKSMNRNIQLKLNASGDSMSGKLDMTGHNVSNVKFPNTFSDATNKLYVQIYAEGDDTEVENICKVGGIISILANKYGFDGNSLNTSLAYVISMFNKYKSLVFIEKVVNSDVSRCTLFVDLKVNIIKIVLGLSKDLFQELKSEIIKEKLFLPLKKDILKRYRRFLVNTAEQVDPEGTNIDLQLLLDKNLLLIDIGFIYLIDSLLHMLLIT